MIKCDDTTIFTVEEILAFAQKENIPLNTDLPSFQRMMNALNSLDCQDEVSNGN